MASEETVHQLMEQLKTIDQYRDSELISKPEWGTITFDAAKQDIETALTIASDLLSMPLVHLTDQAAQDIMTPIPRVASYIGEIDEFKIEGAPPEQSRDRISSALKDASAQLHTVSSQWIPYLAHKRGDFSERIRQFEQLVDNAKGRLDETDAYAKSTRDEIDKVVEATREASASAGVGTFTNEFAREAEELDRASRKWLVYATTLGYITLGIPLWWIFWPSLPDDASSWMTLHHIVAKVPTVAILFAATVWCGRMYRTLRHQSSINKHRALSLKTFQAFVEATDDPATRDAVLMAATKSIFSNVPTGFVDERAGSQDASISVMEVGKSAGKALPRRSTSPDA